MNNWGIDMMSFLHKRRRAYGKPRIHTDFGPWVWTALITAALFVAVRML